jgi:hypothetical protein
MVKSFYHGQNDVGSDAERACGSREVSVGPCRGPCLSCLVLLVRRGPAAAGKYRLVPAGGFAYAVWSYQCGEGLRHNVMYYCSVYAYQQFL